MSKKERVYKVFYCWQSNDSKTSCIIKKELLRQLYKLESDTNCKFYIVEDTRGVAGMTPIVEKVMKEISQCDIFVCDITPVSYRHNNHRNKLMPNSNVMFELGYAYHCLNSSQIIAVVNYNKENSVSGDMPFDIIHLKQIVITENFGEDLGHELNKTYNYLLKKHKWYERVLYKLWGFFKKDNNTLRFNDDERQKLLALMDKPAKYFSTILSAAFPGVHSKTYKGEEMSSRLGILFQQAPFFKQSNQAPLVLIIDNENFEITDYKSLNNGHYLIGEEELNISSITVKRDECNKEESQVELECEGIDNIQADTYFKDNIIEKMESYIEFAVYKKSKGKELIISKELFEDNAAYDKQGNWTSLSGKTERRRVHTTNRFKAIIKSRSNVEKQKSTYDSMNSVCKRYSNINVINYKR